MTDHMTRRLASFALALLAGAGARAATINTTLTVNATGALSGTTFTASGTATLTNVGTGGATANGTFSSTLSLTSTDASGNLTAPYTITLSGGAGTITGTLKVPATILTGSGTGSATVTGGTYGGGVSGGSFPSLAGSGSIGLSGVSLTFTGAGQIITGGGGGTVGTPTPTITAVLDAGSYTSNIAQGSIFVIKGTNLSGSGFTQMGFPLPTSSGSATGNVKITFTPATGGTGTDAYLVYLYNTGGVNQLAAVLPSTVAAGNYNVTVTYNSTASGPFAATVVARKLGLITADSSGTGLAVIQNYISSAQLDIDRFTTFSSGGYTFSPSKPSQVLIAWATGMGAVTGGDNTASPGFDFTKNGVNVQVIVGGVSITPLYAGRAPGLAGADQINFQLPANVPTGCIVSFQVSVNGQLSNPSFIAIAPDANSSTCVQPGFTASQLQQFDSGTSFTVGAFSLTQFSTNVAQFGTVKEDLASGGFYRFTGFQLAGLAQYQAQISASGSCYVSHVVSTSSSAQTGGLGITGLDAGTVTLSGPSGSGLSNTAFTQDPTYLSYYISLGTEGITIPGQTNNYKLVGGQYTVNGAGGKDVGAFQASLTLGSPLTLTGGLPSSVTESAGLTLNWTGGNSSDIVYISGSSSTSTGTGANLTVDSWTFVCTTTAGAGTFTVPASILTQLPKVAATSTGGGGFLEFASAVNPTTFTAPLTAGGKVDYTAFLSEVGYGATVSYQ